MVGVPRRSNPNAASGVIRKPLRATRARIRSTNASYGVSRSAWSKCWTTVTSTPGRFETLEPLVRVEQERRRLPHQDLVGVVVEGDDRRPGATGRRLGDEVVEQVCVAAMEAVEDADDDEGRTELGASASMPWTTSIGVRRRAAAAAGRDEDLVRGETSRSTRGDRHERAVGPDQPVVVGRAGQAARRPDELALGDGSQLIRGQGHDREGVETRVDRQQETASGPPGSRRRRRGSRRAASASSIVNGPDAVRVSAPR